MINICTIPKELFSPFFETIHNVAPDVEMHFTRDNIMTSSRSLCGVSMICASLNIPCESEHVIKLPLTGLITYGSKPSTDVILAIDGNKLVIKIGKAKYSISTLADPHIKYDSIPDKLKFESCIPVSKNDMMLFIDNILKPLKDPASTLLFELKGGVYTVSSTIKEDTLEYLFDGEFNSIPNARTRVPHDRVSDITKHYKLFDTFEISFNTNYPLKIDMKTNNDTISVTGLVAPRIDDGDNNE